MDKEDWVHLPEEAERQEYVMAEQGIIYTGTRHYIGARDWNYGQVYIHLTSLGFMAGFTKRGKPPLSQEQSALLAGWPSLSQEWSI